MFVWGGFGGADRDNIEMIKPFESLFGAMVICELLKKGSQRQTKQIWKYLNLT